MLGKLLFIILPVTLVASVGMWTLVNYWNDEYGYMELSVSDFTREEAAKVFLLIIISILMGVVSNLVYITLHGGINV